MTTDKLGTEALRYLIYNNYNNGLVYKKVIHECDIYISTPEMVNND